jgi:hypothetical protein
VAAVLLLAVPVARRLAAGAGRRELLGLFLLLAFLLIGGLIPTPIFGQYLFALVPLAALALAWGAAAADNRLIARWWVLGVAAVSVPFGTERYWAGVDQLPFPSTWEPVRAHRQGVLIREQAGPGPVLTFAPVLPLEGGAAIYPGLVTAHYAYRVGDYVADPLRARLKLTAAADAKALFATAPPAAIVTGFAKALEAPWVSFARSTGYAEVPLRSGDVLWLRPDVARTAPPIGRQPADPSNPAGAEEGSER